MTSMDFVAFDLGASNGRSLLGQFDGAKIRLKELNRFSNDYIKRGDGYYWDVQRLYSCILEGIGEHRKTSNNHMSGVGIDTWGVDFGLIDEAGELLGNPNAYRDPRGARGMKAFHKKHGERAAFDITGIANQEYNTIYQLYSMVVQKDERLKKADKLLLMPDLLGYMLCGEVSGEYTHATTTQMISAKTGDWSNEIVNMLGIKDTLLPTIQRSGQTKGNVKRAILDEIGISSSIPVINVGAHDTASAVVALPVENEQFAFLSSGTWSLIGILPDKPVINDCVFENGFSNEGTVQCGTRLLQNIMGLWIIQCCKKQWDKEEELSWTDVVNAAEAQKPFTAFIDVNCDDFFEAENMTAKIQKYCKDTHQPVPQTKGEIARVVFDSLATSYRKAFDILEKLYGRRIEVLHILGGGSQNNLLNQLSANAIDRPVIAGPVEATAIGNLMAQVMASGEVKDYSELRQVVKNSFECRTFEPADTGLWDENYSKYSELIAQKNKTA